MKHVILTASILSFIIGIFVFNIFLSPSISGHTYIVEDGDTTILPNVKIAIESRQIGHNRNSKGEYLRSYTLQSDESGYYSKDLRYTFYGISHEVVYSKKGLNQFMYIAKADNNHDIYFDVYINQDNPHANSTCESEIIRRHAGNTIYAYLFFAVIIIIGFLLINRSLVNKIGDLIHGYRTKPFTDWDEEAQNKILDKIYCTTCSTEVKMIYESQEEVSGMSFIHGECAVCSEKLRARIN